MDQQVLAVTFLTSVDFLLYPASIFSCLLLLTISFSGQLSQADWSLLPCSVNWLSLSSLGPPFPPPLLVSWEISPSVLCVGFMPKQTKRSSEWRQHKRKRIATHRITHLLGTDFYGYHCRKEMAGFFRTDTTCREN